MSADIQLDMTALSPVLHPDLPFMYRPPAQHQPEISPSSDMASPSIASFDLPLLSDFNNVSLEMYPSPISSPATASPQPAIKQDNDRVVTPSTTKSTQAHKPAPKRKRENRYKNAPPSVLSRRRAQNRASQRAYRERKDQRIRDLEGILEDYKQKHEALGQAYAALHMEVLRLHSAHTDAHAHPAMGMGIPFNTTHDGPSTAGVGVLPMEGEWQFFPVMTSFPA